MKTSLKEEMQILWPFYLDTFFSGVVSAIAAPVIIIYFQSLSLNFFGISLIFAIPLIATLLFEIPTGAIADLYGRKFSVLLGMFLEAVLLFIVPFFKEIALIIFVFFLSKVAGTFISGADTAWVTDLLKHKKKSYLLQNYYSKLITFTGIGVVVGGILSSIVVLFMGLNGVWFIAGIAEALIAVILLVFAKEHFVKTKVKIKEAFNKSIENAKKGLDYILKHPVLFYFLVDTIIWSFAAIWSISWQPYFKNLGLANEHFGLLFALIGAIGIIAPFASNYVLRLVKSEKMALISAQIVQVVVFSLLIIVSNLWYALFLFILSHPVGIAIGPIAARFKQQFIPSKNRATINSILNAVKVPGMMVGLLVGGLLLDKFGVRFSFVLIVMSAICSIVLYSLMKPEKAKIHI